MQNAMQFVTVDKLELIGVDTVLFHIDMTRHVHLRDPNVVQNAMDQYMSFFPTVHSWSAVANNGILVIQVVGQVDLDAADKWIKE